MRGAGTKFNTIEFVAAMRGLTSAMLEEATAHSELMKQNDINQGTLTNIRKLAIKHLELSLSYQIQMQNWRNDIAISNYADSVRLIEENLIKIIKMSKEILQRSACNS